MRFLKEALGVYYICFRQMKAEFYNKYRKSEMIEDTPDIFTRLITQIPLSPDTDHMVIVCGRSCIGKSYFLNVINVMKRKLYIEKKTKKWRVNFRPMNSPKDMRPNSLWLSRPKIIRTLGHPRTAILLGIPGSEYQKRLIERGKLLNSPRRERMIARQRHYTVAHLNKKLTTHYNQFVEELESTYQIPYIFVDGRNNYPVLDAASFFNLFKEDL